MENQIIIRNDTAFSNITAFEGAQRMAVMLSKSDLVPTQYRDNIANCVISLEMSQRLGMSPLMVMQNMYIVHGKPAWSSQFMISCINGSGRFSPLRYDLKGAENSDDRTCIAWATDKDGQRLESPAVSIGMAKKEGWYGKAGSKWQTMPELMLRYRAATFFARTYCPELAMGMKAVEEVEDIGQLEVIDMPPPSTPDRDAGKSEKSKAVAERLKERNQAAKVTPETPADATESKPVDKEPTQEKERLTEPPESHKKLFMKYDNHKQKIDAITAGLGLPNFPEIDWTDPDNTVKLDEVFRLFSGGKK